MTDQRSPRSHRAVLAEEPITIADHERPVAGPVAVLPEQRELFSEAIGTGGGEVRELGADTRGVVWLSGQDPDGLAAVLEEHPQIGWVQLPLAGVERFSDLITRTARPGLVWTSAKGAFAEPVAEHALMLALALLREIPKRVRATSWATVPEGRSLYGMNVVLVGAGGIALEFLRLAAPFDVDVTVVRRSSDPVAGATRTVSVDRLDEVLPEADVVVLAAALTAGTSGLIGAEQLRLMKDDAVLVNIARGGLVDTDALADALAARTIHAAALDVTDPEPLPDGHRLWDEPNCLITPHAADTPEMVAPLLAERVRLNTLALLGRGDFVGLIDPVAGY